MLLVTVGYDDSLFDRLRGEMRILEFGFSTDTFP